MAKSKSQRGRMSKTKGKVGEREVAALLKDFGFEARRGQQFSGDGAPDVIHNLSVAPDCNIHIEVKRRETFPLWASLEQANEDAPPGDIPVVFHRKSGKPWAVVMDAEDFLVIMKELAKHGT